MLDDKTRKLLLSNPIVTSFEDDDLKQFQKIQRICYMHDNCCAIIYVGYMYTTIAYMIQLSNLYINTVNEFGKIDFENNQFYLDINKGKKYIPYFTTLFLKRQCLEEPYFLINGEAGEIFVAQQFYVDDIKTQTDFTKRVYGLFQIGRKLYQEQEKAKVNLKKVSYAREIAMGIKFLLHFT
ncbi:hypothetical protein [Segatella copri]|nr:hypothetical protein [Segatella copri]